MEVKLANVLTCIASLGLAKKNHIVLLQDFTNDSDFSCVIGKLIHHGYVEPVTDETDTYKVTPYGLSWVSYISADNDDYISDEECDIAITILKYLALPSNSPISFDAICDEFDFDNEDILEAVELLEELGYIVPDDEDLEVEDKTFEINQSYSDYIDYLFSL